ncbi:Cytochrome b5-like Heme/Steroid binding domain protein [uncultured archaeon]|nr:Cytochrome b5-like Heme/Steroid binding domain protein [uncultured archaeon]
MTRSIQSLLPLLGAAFVFLFLLAGCTQGPGGSSGQYVPGSNYNTDSGSGPEAASGGSGAQGSPSGGYGAPDWSNLPAYSLSDVKAHATPSDCWVAINGSVFNFSNSPLMQNANFSALCGTDATSSLPSTAGRGAGNFSRNGTRGMMNASGGYGGRTAGTRGPGAYGGQPGSGPGGMMGGYARMRIGRLAD